MTNAIQNPEDNLFLVYNKKSDSKNKIASSDSLDNMKKLLAKFWGQENQDLIEITYTGLVFNNSINTYVMVTKINKSAFNKGYIAIFCGHLA